MFVPKSTCIIVWCASKKVNGGYPLLVCFKSKSVQHVICSLSLPNACFTALHNVQFIDCSPLHTVWWQTIALSPAVPLFLVVHFNFLYARPPVPCTLTVRLFFFHISLHKVSRSLRLAFRIQIISFLSPAKRIPLKQRRRCAASSSPRSEFELFEGRFGFDHEPEKQRPKV